MNKKITLKKGKIKKNTPTLEATKRSGYDKIFLLSGLLWFKGRCFYGMWLVAGMERVGGETGPLLSVVVGC